MNVKHVVLMILGMSTQTAMAVSSNNPATVDDVHQYVNKILFEQHAGSSGVPGEPGGTGATGLTGATGDNPVGLSGLTGSTGALGAVGINGTIGSTGSTGSTGEVGMIGMTGAVGSTGSTGLLGLTGSSGTTGTSGVLGSVGGTGLIGSTGVMGSTGDLGITGYVGATGIIGFTGPTGIGVTGSVGPTGSVVTAPFVTYQVGQIAQGGLVVYVDASGQHGLVVAAQDMGEISGDTITPQTYPAMGYTGTNYDMPTLSENGTGMGSGLFNTIVIQILNSKYAQNNGQSALNAYASGAASLYTGNASSSVATFENCGNSNTCVGGFYLPTYQELQTAAYYLCTAASLPSGVQPLTIGAEYWLSTNSETDLTKPGDLFDVFKWNSCANSTTVTQKSASTLLYVRPVRYF